MSNPDIVPCIWLDDQAEQVAAAYVRIFPGSRIGASSRYPQSADNPSGRPRGSILTVEVDVAGTRFTLLNGGPNRRRRPIRTTRGADRAPPSCKRPFCSS